MPAHNKILNDCRIDGCGIYCIDTFDAGVLSQQTRAFDLALTMVGKDPLRCIIPDARDDHERIFKRANKSSVGARRRGVALGRPPKITQHQQRVALAPLRIRKQCAGQIAKSYNVSHGAISRLSP